MLYYQYQLLWFFPSLHVLDKMSCVLDVELVEFFKFSTVDLPEDIDKEIFNIVENMDNASKKLIYKLLTAAFTTVG